MDEEKGSAPQHERILANRNVLAARYKQRKAGERRSVSWVEAEQASLGAPVAGGGRRRRSPLASPSNECSNRLTAWLRGLKFLRQCLGP